MGRLDHDYIIFEWDDNKSASNLKKHGLAFEEVIGAFYDTRALTQRHQIVDGEVRYRTLGMVDGITILFVGHLSYDNKIGVEVVRIITARQATPKERRIYYDHD